MFAAAPVAVLVNKIGGLYERDELVLRKTTLDEAPALLQISGLFALIVYLGHHRLVHMGMTPPLVSSSGSPPSLRCSWPHERPPARLPPHEARALPRPR